MEGCDVTEIKKNERKQKKEKDKYKTHIKKRRTRAKGVQGAGEGRPVGQ